VKHHLTVAILPGESETAEQKHRKLQKPELEIDGELKREQFHRQRSQLTFRIRITWILSFQMRREEPTPNDIGLLEATKVGPVVRSRSQPQDQG
jgi:hypothetical protein